MNQTRKKRKATKTKELSSTDHDRLKSQAHFDENVVSCLNNEAQTEQNYLPKID